MDMGYWIVDGIWDMGYGIWDNMRIGIVMVSKDTLVWFRDGFLREGGKWIWVIFRMRGDGMGMGLDWG